MRRFDFDLLHTLITVADLGSLSAASLKLCRSQSAVSEQVRKLEDFCGLQLLVRSKKGVSLTPAGGRLLGHARKLLLQNDIAYQDMQGVLLAGDLRLAITDYFRPTSIAEFLKHLGQQYPRLRLHVSVRKSAAIEQDAGSTDFDIGLSMRILGEPKAERQGPHRRIPLRRESLSWVAGASFDMAAADPLPLVAMPETCSLQRFIVRKLEAGRVPYFIAHSASGVGGLQSALSAGLGISCLNSSAIPPGAGIRECGEKLPPLPEVEFSLLVNRASEGKTVEEIAHMLVERLS